MKTLSDIDTFHAKRDGHNAQASELRAILVAKYEAANESFYMLRDSDPNYQDKRTDFFLGKRDAISDLISYIDKTMSHYGVTITK